MGDSTINPLQEKRCSRCGEIKPLEMFSFKYKSRGIRSGHCKECQKGLFRKHYETHLTGIRAKTAAFNRVAVARNRAYVTAHLSTHPCVDCGEADPVVLDFDHVRGVKSKGISLMIHDSNSLERIQAEIDKCDVRCANCHRRRHHSERMKKSKR